MNLEKPPDRYESRRHRLPTRRKERFLSIEALLFESKSMRLRLSRFKLPPTPPSGRPGSDFMCVHVFNQDEPDEEQEE